MRLVILSLISFSLMAQSTVPVDLIVNWPPQQLVTTKYGPVPKWAIFGELVGCNRGQSGITFGQGDVVALLRVNAGLQAFSIEDALLLVGNAQSDSKWNRAKALISASATSIVQAKATGLIGGGSATGVAVVIGAQATSILLPNLQGALSLKQVIQYSKDGLQATMSVPPGRCTAPYSVLFATPGPSPAAANSSVTVHAQVPENR